MRGLILLQLQLGAEEEPGLPVEERQQRKKMACGLEGDASSV